MKTSLLIIAWVLVFIGFVGTVHAVTEFTPIQNISNTNHESFNPFVVTDGKTIFIAWTEFTQGNQGSDVLFSKSTDGGQTFSVPLKISNKQGSSIIPFIVTDGKTIFITWTYRYQDTHSEVFLSKSTDGGVTFSTPLNLSNNKGYSGVPFMLINGTDIFIAWIDSVIDGSWIVLSNSTDEGETFSTPQKINQKKGFSNAPSLSSDGKTLFATWSYHVFQESPYDVIFTKSKINELLTSVESPDKISLMDKSESVNNKNQTGDSESKIANYTTAKIEWNKHVSEIGDYGLLKITDPDMNVDPTRVDIFTAKAWSNTDPQGISLDMIESGINTSEFYIDVEFTTGNSGIQMLKTVDGDVVTALYHDNTIPDKLGTSMDLTDMMNIIGKHIPPLQQLDQGTPIEKITCRDESFSLFVKDGSPLCLSESTHAKLVTRGYFD